MEETHVRSTKKPSCLIIPSEESCRHFWSLSKLVFTHKKKSVFRKQLGIVKNHVRMGIENARIDHK